MPPLHHLHLPSGVRPARRFRHDLRPWCYRYSTARCRWYCGGHGEYGVGLAVSDALARAQWVLLYVPRSAGSTATVRSPSPCVPLLHGSGHIPADVAALRRRKPAYSQHMAGIHGGLVVPRHVVQPVVVVVVRIRVGPRHLHISSGSGHPTLGSPNRCRSPPR